MERFLEGSTLMKRTSLRTRRTRRPAAESRVMAAYRAAHPICEACRREPTRDSHHIVSEKSGGPAEPWNLLALCFFDHTNGFHLWGWKRFCDRYPHLAGKVTAARLRMGRKTT
jgi:hypothetical protein